MEAKDTIMSDDQEAEVLLRIAERCISAGENQYKSNKAQREGRRLAQAEISFKAGYEAGWQGERNFILHCENDRKAGIREVVEWVDDNIWFVAKTEPQSMWQAFKKERGL